MDRFKQHYLTLQVKERDLLAQRAGTTRGTLNQIVYGGKHIELGLADCLIALCPGLTLEDLPLTDRARHQHMVRSAPSSHELREEA
ncbi:hypothetical protein J2789_004483 [Variovorax paradoxus]|nr:hypothetical protein [Variovorax paradoxus]